MALRCSCLFELLRWKALKWGNNAVSEWGRMILLVSPASCGAAACWFLLFELKGKSQKKSEGLHQKI